MSGLFGKIPGSVCETLMLISQAVKSDLPLAEAVRLSVSDRFQSPNTVDRAFLKLAELLEKGVDPKTAVRQSGLPGYAADIFETSLQNNNFAETFDEIIRLEAAHSAAVNRIIQTLIYPILLFLSVVVVMLCILLKTIPHLENIFLDFGLSLPPLTIALVWTSRLLREGPLCYGILTFLVLFFVVARLIIPRFWYMVPIFGRIGKSLKMYRMLKQMAWLIHQNVPLPEALELCAETMHNRAYKNDCLHAAEAARKGAPFAEIVLYFPWLFPAWLAPMLAADSSGDDVVRSLRRAAETADHYKESALLFLQSMSMPVYIMILFGGVGIVVIAMFMPLIKLITNLSTS
ncbi:pilus assembly protein PilC [Campylobacterota bacterium]|nr:pilus assembly protein PilC [Campylobacterota bacterium]